MTEKKSFNNTLASEDLRSTLPYAASGGGTLQSLSDLLAHNLRIDQIGELKGNNPTIPINDLRGNDAINYSKEERLIRCKLASLYRLIDINGWSQSIYNHISARICENDDSFLLNPFGLLYHEVQASSLVQIDLGGKIIDPGSSILGINKAGWNLHAALHSSRKDVNCVVHVHLPDVTAVSCIRAGLLPISAEASELLSNAHVRYHDYEGILINEEEQKHIQSDLGPDAKILFLRNHGVAIAAKSIPEAWYLLKRVITACQTQMRLLQLGCGNALLTKLPESENVNGMPNVKSNSGNRPFDGLVENGYENGDVTSNGIANGDNSNEEEWNHIEQEFEAQMRLLDSAGFRTGHVYRQPNLLRRGHYGNAMGGAGGLDSTMLSTGADFFTTDFTSAGEMSGTDDVANATAAGTIQKAKIAESVRINKLKSTPINGNVLNGDVSLPISKSYNNNELTSDLLHATNDAELTLPMVASSPYSKGRPNVSANTKTASLPHDNANKLKVDGLVRDSKTLQNKDDGTSDQDESHLKVKKDKKHRSFRGLFGKKEKEVSVN